MYAGLQQLGVIGATKTFWPWLQLPHLHSQCAMHQAELVLPQPAGDIASVNSLNELD